MSPWGTGASSFFSSGISVTSASVATDSTSREPGWGRSAGPPALLAWSLVAPKPTKKKPLKLEAFLASSSPRQAQEVRASTDSIFWDDVPVWNR